MSTTSMPFPRSFLRALHLSERVRLPAGNAPFSDAESAELGAVRMSEHRALVGLGTEAARAARWAALGLSEHDAQRLFDESLASLAERCTSAPAWVTVVLEAYGGQAPIARERATLSSLASPLVTLAERALTREATRIAAAHAGVPFLPATVGRVLVAGLEAELGRMLQRTLVLEMHVARLEQRLSGDTAEARFASYLGWLSAPGTMLRLFEEYPVLARLLAEHTERRIAVASELLQRLAADWPAITRALGLPDDPGELTRAAMAGDHHDEGRAVTMLQWSSGAELAYKPKPLAVDVHFQELVAWLNERGASPPLPILPVLDCGGHGYTAVVHPKACVTEGAVGRFFERQGELLALFYGLLATDFHCENVIASGEHPYPIDLESLFHGEIGNLDLPLSDGALESEIIYSVLRVGLLPERARDQGGATGVDLSGLGGDDGQLSAVGQPAWEGAGTDEMRLVRKRLPLIGGDNRPSLRGEPVSALAWTDSLVSGMTHMYRLLLEHREELCRRGGVLSAFAGDVVRIIARPTRVYASLLGESYHPDLLRDALDRDVFFDRLWSFAPGRDRLAALVRMEQEDLWRGDIPKLTARPGERDLVHPRGRLERFFSDTGLGLTSRHLGRFGPADLAHQQWIVRAAMITLATDARSGRWVRYTPDPEACELSREALIAAAERIADRLETKAIRGGEEATWLGLGFVGEHWVLAPLGTDLYGGLLGVALFLAQLGALTGRQKYRDLGERAMCTWLRKERDAGASADAIGGYGGLGAVVYGLARLSRLWDRADLLDVARRRLALFEPLIASDEIFDVLSGSAGAIGALVAYHDMTGDSEALSISHLCAERLLARAAPMTGGLGWPVAETDGRALAGFSHGAAGIAWALLRLFERTGEERYRETASAAVRYERSLFVAAEGNYYDLRPSALAGKDAQFTHAWCHGAPGIGLARAAQLSLLDERARDEVRITANTTLGSLGRGHSVCHGDLGNLELPLRAAALLGDEAMERRARRALGAAVANGEREGWLSGVPLAVETPGLMVGLAGMGYQLLRFAAPELVPSVLLLEAPRPAASGTLGS